VCFGSKFQTKNEKEKRELNNVPDKAYTFHSEVQRTKSSYSSQDATSTTKRWRGAQIQTAEFGKSEQVLVFNDLLLQP
jgi:hypothetical protein